MVNRDFREIKGAARLVSDIKAEVVAVDLMDKEKDIDQVIILPTGLFKRLFRRDVITIKSTEDENTGEELIYIEVSRNSLYDLLPQGLFHQSDPKKKKKSTLDVIDEIKKNRVEEEAARNFFGPFEKEFYRARILIEVEERNSILGFSDHYKNELFLRLWPELEEIDNEFLAIIFQILPVVHKAVGNMELIALYLSEVIGTEVEIKRKYLPIPIPNDEKNQTLGEAHMGMDMIIGKYIPDYDSYAEVNIGPVEKSELTQYLENGRIKKVIDLLYQYFFPAELEIVTNILLFSADETLTLSEEPFEGRLSLTSRI